MRPRVAGSSEADARREPLRGVRRLIAEHMARAHREVPPVTWVEECDFGRVDLSLLVPTVLKACALSLREYPGAERTARRRRDRLPRALRPRHRGPDRAGPRRPGRPRLRLAPDRGAGGRRHAPCRRRPRRDARARGAARLDLHGDERGQARRPLPHADRQLPGGGDPRNRPDRAASRRSCDGEIVVRRVGTVAVTFDHRVVDGARAAEFGLAVIRRLEQPALPSRRVRRKPDRIGGFSGCGGRRPHVGLIIRSIRGALARPSTRPTTRCSLIRRRVGTDPDAKTVGQLRMADDVDASNAQAAPFFPRQVRQEALHAPGRSGALVGEEHEQREARRP